MNIRTNSNIVEQPIGKSALRPKARLLRTLGSDLISSDKVALIELVKNSYDADASAVIIRFHGPLIEGQGRLEIWDDGHGMNVQTLQNSWLDIASDSKKRNPSSNKGRRVLGEKGIGRLAASRLGQEMLLITRMSNSLEVNLLINWEEFDRDDAYLDEIEIAWEVNEPDLFALEGHSRRIFSDAGALDSQPEQGTLIQIDGLAHDWVRSDLIELRTALMRLIRPRPIKPSHGEHDGSVISDFEIILDFVDTGSDLDDLAGSVGTSSELQTPHYNLVGSVDDQGTATMRYTQQTPEMNENISFKQLWSDGSRKPQAGPFEFEISVWDRDDAAIKRSLNMAGNNEISPTSSDLKGFRDTLNEVSGISIFRDGFRVMPFGESGDDWLGLDLSRVQTPTRRVSNNQVIGHIFISADSNRGLKDQSNREGLIDGIAYEDLRVLVKAALNELEYRRYLARRVEKTQKPPKGGLFHRFDLKDIRDRLIKSYPTDKQLLKLLDEKNKDIQDGVEEVQNVLSRYSRLATLGSLVDRILHDGRTIITRLKTNSRFAIKDLNKSSINDVKKIELAKESFSKTTTQAELLSTLFKQIEPFGGRKRGRPVEIDTSDVIAKTLSILQLEADDRRVQLIGDDEKILVKYDESELITVLTNLVQNAIYWTSTMPIDHQRRVILSAHRRADNSVSFIVSDSGPGIEESMREHIFDPYFSSKPDGIGLGLSIAGNIVENIYEGQLSLINDGPLQGATFEARFKKRSI